MISMPDSLVINVYMIKLFLLFSAQGSRIWRSDNLYPCSLYHVQTPVRLKDMSATSLTTVLYSPLQFSDEKPVCK